MTTLPMEDMSNISSSLGVSAERSCDHSTDHTATAGSLKRRKLKEWDLPLKPKPETEIVTTYLNDFVTSHADWKWKNPTPPLKDRLLLALKKQEKFDPLFDKQLYDTWKQFFVESHGFVILWFDGATEGASHKAIGLTRQLSKDDIEFLKDKNIGVATAKSSNDHCVVVLSRDDLTADPWKVKYCTSVVEIKMFDSSICLIEDDTGLANPPDLRKSGPIVQSISYLSTLVWPSLVHMRSPQRKEMRITAIAGQRHNQKASAFKNARFIRGSYIAPQRCGAPFTYRIESFASATNDPEATLTLFEYLHNVEVGFNFAFEYWTRNDHPASMAPLGGLDLPETISTFCSKHNIQPTLIGTPAESNDIKVGQGDMWEMNAAPKDLPFIGKIKTILGEHPSAEKKEMLVKVSSESAFSTWIAASDSISALITLRDAKVSLGCLLGFQSTTTGMVTIMEDLRAQNFETLSPGRNGLCISALWRALRRILEDTLIPAAKLGIVHADIRPGYDSTANILCCNNNDGAASSIARLELIDFDSFCEPIVIPDHDKRALQGVDAMNYLFLQVCLLGHTWKEHTSQRNVEGKVFSRMSTNYGIGNPDFPSLPEESIMMVWNYFDSKFANRNTAFSCTDEETKAMAEWRKKNNNKAQQKYHDDKWFHEIFVAVGICSQ